MRTGLFILLLCCTMVSYASLPQQILYPNRRHSTSHGGYITVRPGFSHKGGLFRKAQPKIKAESVKPKPILKGNLQQKQAIPQVF
jgi:hypothetical protein